MASSQTKYNPVMMSTLTKSKESHLQPLIFDALTLDGNKFLEWNNDAKTFLAAGKLVNVLDAKITAELPPVCKWQTLLILRRHLDTSLQ